MLTTLKNEWVWWRKSGWAIGTFDGRHPKFKSFFVYHDKSGYVDYPVVYDDGRVGFDNPERIPQYVRRVLEKNAARWRGIKMKRGVV